MTGMQRPDTRGPNMSQADRLPAMPFSDQEIDPRADGSACRIQNEIIDVCGARKHELQNLNTEREEKAGPYRFGEIVEFFEYERQHDPDGNEHRDVSDDVQFIAFVYVRNEIEAQNIPKDLILNLPDVKKELAPPKIKPIDAKEQPIIMPESQQPNAETEPQEIVEEYEEPTYNKEYEPTLVKVVGQLHHYIQVKEKHIRQKVIQHITKKKFVQTTYPKIEPIIIHP